MNDACGSTRCDNIFVLAPTQVIDLRRSAARTLWDQGWGRARFPSFASYLETIPKIPATPAFGNFRTLVLVDTSMRLTDACRVLGIDYQGDDTVFSVYGDVVPAPEVYWLWCDTGAANRGRSGYEVRHESPHNVRGLTAFEGVCMYAQHATCLQQFSLNLVASRLGSFPAYNACLLMYEGLPTLGVAEYCVGAADRGAPVCVW